MRSTKLVAMLVGVVLATAAPAAYAMPIDPVGSPAVTQSPSDDVPPPPSSIAMSGGRPVRGAAHAGRQHRGRRRAAGARRVRLGVGRDRRGRRGRAGARVRGRRDRTPAHRDRVSPMNALRIRSAGLLGAGAALIALAASTPARADTVTDWNSHATDALITNARQGPTVSTIHLAIVHGAVYDAVNSIAGRYEPYLVKVRAKRWYSQDAAAATAAYRVLAGCLQPARDPGAALPGVAGRDPARRARDGGIPWARCRGGDARGARGRRPLSREHVPLPRSGDARRGVAGRAVAARGFAHGQRPGSVGQGRSAVPDRGPEPVRIERAGPA